jgi:hypothetical protein
MLWLDYVKFLYSFVENVPKAIITIQEIDAKSSENKEITKGLRSTFVCNFKLIISIRTLNYKRMF